MTEVRDRIANPSINFPRSEEEAFQAVLHSVRRALTEGTYVAGIGLLNRVYTTDAGLGQKRTQEQADWLTKAQELIKAQLEDRLDQLDLEYRR